MLILASKSPTRKLLLENAGLRFSVHSAAIDERVLEDEHLTRGGNRKALAGHLAIAKANAVSAEYPKAWVIGADQTLEFEGNGLHKPQTRDAAAERLRAMAGTTHYLHSGVALVRDGQIVWSDVESAALTFRQFSARELERVLELEGDATLDSVGGYRLEGPSIRLFQAIDGDYFTILGLPLLPLIAAIGVHAPELLEAQ